MSRLLRGLSPEPPARKVFDEEFPTNLEPVVNEEESEKLHGLAPAQPDYRIRAWGVNSYARLPALGGGASGRRPGSPVTVFRRP